MSKQFKRKVKQPKLPCGLAHWSPAHFPVGTQVVFDETTSYSFIDKGGVYTVTGVSENGPRSWVIYLLEPISGGESYPRFMNIDHVSKIVGRVHVDPKDYADIDTSERHRIMHCYIRHETRDLQMLVPKPKGHYVSRGVQFLRWTTSDKMMEENYVDTERLINDLLFLGIVTKKKVTNGRYEDYFVRTASKKKLKRFLKRNINRYLEKMDDVVKREDEELSRMMEKDFDREYDSRFSLDSLWRDSQAVSRGESTGGDLAKAAESFVGESVQHLYSEKHMDVAYVANRKALEGSNYMEDHRDLPDVEPPREDPLNGEKPSSPYYFD